MPRSDSDGYDVVLLGATGFTGRLTAERLASHGPAGLRWAIAGLDPHRLAAVQEALAAHGGAGATVETVVADVTDPTSLRRLAERAAVIATSVGPFVERGEQVVAACADLGADYVDLAGEPEFVDRMWLAYHERASATGARLVHSCGFDSVPHDLGAWFTVQQLPEGVPLTVKGFVRAYGALSGGSHHSAVRALSRLRQARAVAGRRRAAERRAAAASKVTSSRRVRALPQRPSRAPDGQGWALPLPTIDPLVVRRSARACERYGPDFAYGHYALVPNLPLAVGAPVALGAMVATAQVRPGRDLLLRLQRQGAGPSAERRARSWFQVCFVGTGGEREVITQVSGGDPGYDETATMLAQSALCLALDADLPSTAGQVTTVQAMGDALRIRLQAHGMTFRRLSAWPSQAGPAAGSRP